MTNLNQMLEVLLFVCSKMADETSLSSKLPVADRTREVWGRMLCCDTLALAFRWARCCSASLNHYASYSLASLCSILCNLFPRLGWYAEGLRRGFEGVLVSLLLTTTGHFSLLLFSIEDFFNWQTFIRNSGIMAYPSKFQKSMDSNRDVEEELQSQAMSLPTTPSSFYYLWICLNLLDEKQIV